MDNYKTISSKLTSLTPFKGNTLYAVTELDRNFSEIANPKFLVFSYSTLIASYDYVTETFWVNPNKYSVTTSKHQNIIRRAWGVK